MATPRPPVPSVPPEVPRLLTNVMQLPEDAPVQTLEKVRGYFMMMARDLRLGILRGELTRDDLVRAAACAIQTLYRGRSIRVYVMKHTRLIVMCRSLELIIRHRNVGMIGNGQIQANLGRLITAINFDVGRFIGEDDASMTWSALVSLYRVVRHVLNLSLERTNRTISMQNFRTVMDVMNRCVIHLRATKLKDMKGSTLEMMLVDFSMAMLKPTVVNETFLGFPALGFVTLAPKTALDPDDVREVYTRTRRLVYFLAGSDTFCMAMPMSPARWDAMGIAALEALEDYNVQRETRRDNGACLYGYLYRFCRMCSRDDCRSEYCYQALERMVTVALDHVHGLFIDFHENDAFLQSSVMEGMDEDQFIVMCKRISCVNFQTYWELSERLEKDPIKLNLRMVSNAFNGVVTKYFVRNHELPHDFKEGLFVGLCYFLQDHVTKGITHTLEAKMFTTTEDEAKERARYHCVPLPDMSVYLREMQYGNVHAVAMQP